MLRTIKYVVLMFQGSSKFEVCIPIAGVQREKEILSIDRIVEDSVEIHIVVISQPITGVFQTVHICRQLSNVTCHVTSDH